MLLIGTTTIASRADADKIANALITTGLTACVQIDGPITAVYRWEGKIETSLEFRLTIKFLDSHANAVDAWMRANHPYETPEWIVVRAEIVAEKYLSWARANSTFSPL